MIGDYQSDASQISGEFQRNNKQLPFTDEKLRESIRDVIEDYFETKQTQLMKPLEKQSLFIAGKLTQENQFLKEKVETLLREIDLYKALPNPSEELSKDLQEKEETLNKLKKEKKRSRIQIRNKKTGKRRN